MTELLDRAIASVRSLPLEQQDDVARMLLQWIGAGQPPIALTAEEESSLAESLAQADARCYASEEEVCAVWAKHGL